MPPADPAGPPQSTFGAPPEVTGNDVVDDGQEEVFSRTAVERGLVEDPKAMDPQDLAQHPKSPGRIDRRS